MIYKFILASVLSIVSLDLNAGGLAGGDVPELISVTVADYTDMMNAIRVEGNILKPLVINDTNGKAVNTLKMTKQLNNAATFNFTYNNKVKTTKIVMENENPSYSFSSISDESDKVVVVVDQTVK